MGPNNRVDELEEAQQLWRSERPHRYVYTIQRQCFCAEGARGPVRVTVDGETVVSQLYGDGRAVDATAAGWFPSVDGLFVVLLEAFDEGAHEIRVTYDPQLGVPVDLWIDYSQNTIDEELGFTVTEAVQPIFWSLDYRKRQPQACRDRGSAFILADAPLYLRARSTTVGSVYKPLSPLVLEPL